MSAATKVIGSALLVAVIAAPSLANEIELPRQLSWTAYDTGSAGFNQAVAIGGELQKATVRHVFAMRRILDQEQQREFDQQVARSLTGSPSE